MDDYETIIHCCEEGQTRCLSWFSLDHKVGWDGNVAACWRHGMVVVMMCVVLLLLVLLGLQVPLLLFTEREKDIADVVVFANCVSCIFKRNKQ